MVANFTREHGLVEEITSKGWFANPAGRQGYEVIILERVGDGGSRFYCSLKPGETLRFSERMFGNFSALAVDTRHARSFSIDREFATRDRGRKVTVQGNVRYRVTDARIVAMETVDPLAELRDKVIAALNRELAKYAESQISPSLVEQIIRNIGPVPHLGLTIEDSEILEFTPDSRLTQQAVTEENLRHDVHINRIKSEAEIEAETQLREAKIRWRQDQHSAIDLTNVNTLMHEYPDLIPQIFGTFAAREQRLIEAQISVIGPAVQAYIQQQQSIDAPIDPEEIARMVRRGIASSSTNVQGSAQPTQIVWGNQAVDALPAPQPAKLDTTNVDKKKPSKGLNDDDTRIRFAD